MTMAEPRREGFAILDLLQSGGLRVAERDAIVRTIVAQGPSLIRRGKVFGLVRDALAASAFAAAASILLLLKVRDSERAPLASTSGPGLPAHTVSAPAQSHVEGRTSLALGTRMQPVASSDRELPSAGSSACSFRVALTQDPRATDTNVQGGAPSFDTPHARGQLAGTSFRVATAASSRVVSAAEGQGRVVRHAFAQAVTSGQTAKPATVVQRTARPTAASLLAQAEALWRKGARAAARRRFRAAAQAPGATGQAAWVRLARLELAADSTQGALAALKAHRAREREGILDAEALWLEVQVLQRAGRDEKALRTARKLVQEHPSAPQAAAARRLIAEIIGP